ncbi:hypothetical protein Bra3105_18460 (plasmid) [Brachybacterium halotolerans subsp. kimchii]|uniref:hypothetical protein n=1 Tax=Brachybacterium halotolerans TaxID=2795215 RepID=UPI001E3FA460|nr:hypothetical protein [Brachybacterium halotolerans]UEJ84615.1 hypothetical protein Bra3105_18460 [Brachybacterium halotolerans subsp. kimchii]
MTSLLELLTQPASTALLGALAGVLGSVVVVAFTGHLAAERETQAYQRQRHDRFEDTLAVLVEVTERWVRDETTLTNMTALEGSDYGEEVDEEAVEELRTQMRSATNRLIVLSPEGPLLQHAEGLADALNSSEGARKALHLTLGVWEGGPDQVHEAAEEEHRAIARVKELTDELVQSNREHVGATRKKASR